MGQFWGSIKKILKSGLLLFISIFLLFNTPGFAQTWRFLGGPQGIYSNDILFLKSGRLLCSTDKGVYISDDFGDSWKTGSDATEFGSFHNLTQRANGNVLAVTDYGIACSYDQGISWSMTYKISHLSDYKVTIAESPVDSSLYYARDSLVYRSTDGGRNWIIIWTGSGVIDSYAINNSGEIFIGERFGQLLRSTDGGRSFQPYSIGFPLEGLIITNILTNNSGGIYIKTYTSPDLILHYENHIVTQVYNGWTNIPLGVTGDGNLIYKADSKIAIYDHNTRQSAFPSAPGFVKDQFAQKAVSYDKVWITSFSSYGLNRSTDGGYTWKDINQGIGYKQCLSVSMTNDGSLLTGTFGFSFWGGLYKSSDHGKSWQSLNPGNDDAYFTKIDNCSNGNIIAGGIHGVYVSGDDGKSWTHNPKIWLVHSQFVSKKGIIYVGDTDKGIWISRNNGISFDSTSGNINNFHILGLGESVKGRIFASANYKGLFYSDDEGRNWTASAPGLFSYNDAYDFKYKNDTVFAATSGGVAYSTDNGSSWDFSYQLFGNVNKILISKEGNILAAVRNTGLYISRNDGQSWEKLNKTIGDLNINDMYLDKFNVLYTATNSGLYSLNLNSAPQPIFPLDMAKDQPSYITLRWNKNRYAANYHLQVSTDSLFQDLLIDNQNIKEEVYKAGPLKYMTEYFWRVAVSTNSEETQYSPVSRFTTVSPHSFSLEQNYPNPFNGTTSIRFAVPYNSRAALKIYNALGQLVTTLFDKEFEIGNHEYIWNASNFPSGLYLMRLETTGPVQSAGFSETKKIMLIK